VYAAGDESSLLRELRADYAGRWRIWETRGRFRARRAGNFLQESRQGAPLYAVSAPDLVALRGLIEVQELIPAGDAGDTRGGSTPPARPLLRCVHSSPPRGRAGGPR
jgi:hypothetical protein